MPQIPDQEYLHITKDTGMFEARRDSVPSREVK